jgi:hypothetical protein
LQCIEVRMAAVAEGSPAAAQAASAAAAAAAAKEAEYHQDVQKLVDLLSKLNPAAKEFVPSSAAATPRKALSADAPVFYYGSVGNGGIGAYPAGADTAGYIGNQQQRMVIKIPHTLLLGIGPDRCWGFDCYLFLHRLLLEDRICFSNFVLDCVIGWWFAWCGSWRSLAKGFLSLPCFVF